MFHKCSGKLSKCSKNHFLLSFYKVETITEVPKALSENVRETSEPSAAGDKMSQTPCELI